MDKDRISNLVTSDFFLVSNQLYDAICPFVIVENYYHRLFWVSAMIVMNAFFIVVDKVFEVIFAFV